MAKDTTAILKELYPKVEKALKNPTKWRNVIQNFLQSRSEALYDIAPIDRIIFTTEDENKLFEALEISKAEVTSALQKTFYYDQIKNENANLVKDECAILSGFKTNSINKEYITYDSDNVSEDDYHIADSDSLKLERSIENAINRVESSTTDFKLCKIASDSNVKTDELRAIIDSIMSSGDNFPLVKELIRNICTYYFANGKNKDVRDIDFLSFSIAPKPNSKDKLYLRNKEIIEQLLLKNSTKYKTRSKRAATKISYNQAILKYFTFLIHEANK